MRAAQWSLLLACLAVAVDDAAAATVATPGKEGAGGTLAGVVNAYWPGSGSPAAGATSITLGSRSSGGAAESIDDGDLLLIIQMQGADIDTTDTGAYGDGVAGDPGSGVSGNLTAGNHEYVIARSTVGAGGGSLTIEGTGGGGGLVNSYVTAAAGAQGVRNYQVIWVPQYTSATLGSTLTAQAWDGETGGVLALDIEDDLALGSATVDLTELGFRGGGGETQGTSGPASLEYREPSTTNRNASKGEGVAGTPRWTYDPTNGVQDNTTEGWTSGSFAAGAPGNAGGGGTDRDGNNHNSGGGGGGNGGAGGRGGFTWNNSSTNGSDLGGFGGAVIDNSATRVVMGGGGGAGSRNAGSNPDASGGVGGGIALIRTWTISGSGTIRSNGGEGVESDNEAGGGGGAGGTISFIALNETSLSGLTLEVDGGVGGNSWDTRSDADLSDAHGPGAGGGAGWILVNVTGSSNSLDGGDHGITLVQAIQYGAQDGENNTVELIDPDDVPGIDAGAEPPLLDTSTKVAVDANGGDLEPNDSIEFTITLTETNGIEATGVRVQDTLDTDLDNLSVDSIPPSPATDNSNLVTGVLDIDNITVPANSSVTIVFSAIVDGSAAAGDLIDNTATITGDKIDESVSIPQLTVSETSVPTTGTKLLYLDHAESGGNDDPEALRRAFPDATNPDGTRVQLTDEDDFADWDINDGESLVGDVEITGDVTAILFLTEEGGGNQRDIEVVLQESDGTDICSDTINNQGLSTTNDSPSEITFTLTGCTGTVTAADGLQVRVYNRTSPDNRRLRIWEASQDEVDALSPNIDESVFSRILIPTDTVINVESVLPYDDTLANGGTEVEVVTPGEDIWLRAVVSDPFGPDDITSATITITDADGTELVTDAAMTDAGDDGTDRTFEYSYTPLDPLPNPVSPLGFWDVEVTAVEGEEVLTVITDNLLDSFELRMPDFLVVKTSPGVHSDPVNGTSGNPKRIPGAVIDYEVEVFNVGRGRPEPGTVDVTDNLPGELLLATDSGNGDPIDFAAGNSGLSFTYATDVTLVTSGGLPEDTTPADGCYDNVTGFVVTPQGQMEGAAPPNKSFTVSYRACLQ